MRKKSDPIMEPLIRKNSLPKGEPIKAINIEIKKERKQSSIEEDDTVDMKIYDLPDIDNVNNRVMCKLLMVSVVCVIFMAVEIVGGIIANSLAIMTDAAHLFADLSGFFISIFSLWLAKKRSTHSMSFGYNRAEVIGALASVILIWILTLILVAEAIIRIISLDFEMDGLFMLGTACFGLVCNLTMGKILHSHGGHDHGGHDHGGHSHGGHSHAGHSHSHGGHGKKKDKVAITNADGTKKALTNIPNPFEDLTHIENSGIPKSELEIIQIDSKSLLLHNQGENHSHNDHSHPHKDHSDHDHKHEKKKCDHDHSDPNHVHKDHKDHDHKHEEHDHSDPNHVHDDHDDKDHEDHKENDEVHDHPHKEGHNHDHKSHKHKHKEHSHHDHKEDKAHNKAHNHPHDHDHEDHEGHDHEDGKEKSKGAKPGLSMVNEADNVNLRAAMIHIIGDTIQSVGVIIAALIIYLKPELKIFDPICTLVFAVIVIFTTIGVSRDCLVVLMEGSPVGINIQEFEDKLKKIPGVMELHDLHIWSISMGKPALSAHIFSNKPNLSLKKATQLCRKYGIYHSTLQVEDWEDRYHPEFIKCAQNIHN